MGDPSEDWSSEVLDSAAKDNSDDSEREDGGCPTFFSSFTLASPKKEAGRVEVGETAVCEGTG